MNTLRKAKQEDKPTLEYLYKCFVAEMNDFDPGDSNSDSEIISWIEKSLSGENAVIFLVESDDGISGFARVQHKERTSDNGGTTIHYAKLSDLYVVPQARRKGIAGTLINASIDWAKISALSEVILNVYENNEAAHTLYKSIGFKDDCAISDNRVRMKYRADENIK